MNNDNMISLFLYWDRYVYLPTYQGKPVDSLKIKDLSIGRINYTKEDDIDYVLIKHIINNEKFRKLDISEKESAIVSTFNRNNDDINYLFNNIRGGYKYNMKWFNITDKEISDIIPVIVVDTIKKLDTKHDDIDSHQLQKNLCLHPGFTFLPLKDAIDTLSTAEKLNKKYGNRYGNIETLFNIDNIVFNIRFKDCSDNDEYVKPVFIESPEHVFLDLQYDVEFNINYTSRFFELTESERRFVLLYELGALYIASNPKINNMAPHNRYREYEYISKYKDYKITDFYYNRRFNLIDTHYKACDNEKSILEIGGDILFLYTTISKVYDFILTDHVYYNRREMSMIVMVMGINVPLYNLHSKMVHELPEKFRQSILIKDYNFSELSKYTEKELITLLGKMNFVIDYKNSIMKDIMNSRRLFDTRYVEYLDRLVDKYMYIKGKNLLIENFGNIYNKKNIIDSICGLTYRKEKSEIEYK